MMARVLQEKYSRSRALFAAYTAKSPAYLRAKFLGHKKPSPGTNEISRQADGLGNACADVGRHCHAVDCGFHFLFALNVAGPSPSGLALLLQWGRCLVGIQHETG
jgi:hypothetical protein